MTMTNIVEHIYKYLPGIDNEGLSDVLNIIERSKDFGNFKSKGTPTNLFELQYANYIITQDPRFIETYREIVIHGCFGEFLEWYEYLTKHILRKDVQEALGISFSASTSDWVTEFKKSELIGWAFQLNDIGVFLRNIDKVERLGEIMTKFFNERKPLSIIDDDYFESDHAQLVLDSITKVLINNDHSELIHQIESDKILCMIEVYGWSNEFNPILLEWIYENKSQISKWV